jgi:hypothetical protein
MRVHARHQALSILVGTNEARRCGLEMEMLCERSGRLDPVDSATSRIGL